MIGRATAGTGTGTGTGDEGPPVHGFVVLVQRRRIFVATARIGWLDGRGAQMASGAVDLRQYRASPDELSARALLGTDLRGETVRDVGLSRSSRLARAWAVATVALRPRR